MAGNGVVLKPSPHVPLCGERIARVFARAGLPEGLLQVVHGHTDAGRRARRAPPVAQVRFTGSARAGREVGEACARGLKRSVLELDGKDAMLVLADANVAARGRAARRGRRSPTRASAAARSSARSCVREVHDRFLAGVVAGGARRCASATRPIRRPSIGPLVARERADARARRWSTRPSRAGATLHCGGPRGEAPLRARPCSAA